MTKMEANVKLAIIMSKNLNDEAFKDSVMNAYDIREIQIDEIIRKLDDNARVLVTWSCYHNDLERCEYLLKEMGGYDEYLGNEKEFDGKAELLTKKETIYHPYVRYANAIMVM